MVGSEQIRLVIVDDDQGILWMLKDKFEAEGYKVSIFTDGPAVMQHVARHGLPHLALIDLSLPSMHGFELSKQLKELGDVPIVFVTGDNETDSVVDGLINYADDYVTKPFQARELSARIKRVLSRVSIDFSYANSPAVSVDDDLSVDFGNSRLLVKDTQVSLTPTEAMLLHILMRNAGRVVPSQTLIRRVWPTGEVYEETLRVHMHRLRRKIEPDLHHPKYIHTERGVGYRFTPAEVRITE